jgi:hypothetical protein
MDFLSGKLLAVVMIGSTHYVDVGQGEDAIIYYPSENVAHMRLPKAEKSLKGQVTLENDGYHVKWEGGPEGFWKIAYEPGTFTYFGPDGEAAGTITRLVPGNVAGF